jgi:cell division protein ZipA
MQASDNPTIDSERLHIMYETAKQLSDGLDTYLLNEQRQPLSEAGLNHYRKLLNL